MEVIFAGGRFRWSGQAWVDEVGRVALSGPRLGRMFLQRFFSRYGYDWQALCDCWFHEGQDICSPAVLRMLAEACLEQLRECPDRRPWVALLCQCYRHLRLSQLALSLAEANLERNDPEILTSHAAVLCDLRRWSEAETMVQRALHFGAGQEARAVRYRLLARRAALGLK